MRFYGNGVLRAPHSSRIVWDFADGPYDTDNPEIIGAAKDQGFSTEAPEPPKAKPPRGAGKTVVLPESKAKGPK